MKKVFFLFIAITLLASGCYKDDIDDLKDKYEALKTEQERQAQALATVQNALQNQLTVTNVTPVSDGWKITFSDNSTVELKHGKDGDDAPYIVEINIVDGNVVFEFSEGEPIVIPMTENFACSIVGVTTVEYFEYGETKVFTISQSGVKNIAVTRPDGWRVSANGNTLTVTAPASDNPFAEHSGIVSIIATGDNATAIAGMRVFAWDWTENYVIDFEGPRILSYLAGPTSYGENLYSSFTGANRYVGYDDPCGLFMMIHEAWGAVDFWNGGIAISQWNDMTTEGFVNQLSVYNSGGYGGSKTFSVVNRGFDNPPAISFNDGETECTFDHFWVANSAYAALSMMNGDGFGAKIFSYDDEDWFKLTITAFDKDENPTGTPVEFYLADFRTSTSPGIITDWTKVDLTPLGNKVHTVKFDVQSSDVGDWGMNTPAYFCFDNLAIRK